MSFFGVLYAAFVALSNGISKGQDLYEDSQLKKRSDVLGQDTYYDHNGVLHDKTSGRAITYYTDPFTGHRLIQDAYTLNTIRDLTLEKRNKDIELAKLKARLEGSEYYEIGKPRDILSRNEYLKLSHKYRWGKSGRLGKRKKNKYGNYTKDLDYSINNIRFDGVGVNYTVIYKKENETKKYIKEVIDSDLYYYTDLETGMAVDVDNKCVAKLKEMDMEPDSFLERINEVKIKYASEWQGEIPISAVLY